MYPHDYLGRWFQSVQFTIPHLSGCVVEAFIGLRHQTVTDAPTLLLLKPTHRCWQWFFLDAGLGFWEQCSATVVKEVCAAEPEAVIDYGRRFHVVGATIHTIVCAPMHQDQGAQITLTFSTGSVRLAPKDATDWDSLATITWIPAETYHA